MYCPKCGAPNDDEVKFCRRCGENLSVVVQAMSKHLPVMLVSKLDNYLERKHERLRRDSLLAGLSGLFLLFSGFWQWTHTAGWPTVFMLLGAVILLLVSAWDFLAYKRSGVGKSETADLSSGQSELTENTQRSLKPTRVTEQTTRLLDSAENHTVDKP